MADDNYIGLISDMKAQIGSNKTDINHLQEDTHEIKQALQEFHEHVRKQDTINEKILMAIEEFSQIISSHATSVSKIEKDANRFKGGLAVIIAIGGIATYMVEHFDKLKQTLRMWLAN